MKRKSIILSEPTEPEEVTDPNVQGNYIVVFKVANGTPEVGDVRKVREGDIIEYYDGGKRTSEVSYVTGKGDKMKVRTCPQTFQGITMRGGDTIFLMNIRKVLRVRPDLKVLTHANLHREFIQVEPEEIKPVEPPPPLPEVTFAPVVNPNRVESPESPLKPAPKIVGAVKSNEGLEMLGFGVGIEAVEVPQFATVSKPHVPVKTPMPVVPLAVVSPVEENVPEKKKRGRPKKIVSEVAVNVSAEGKNETPMQKWRRLRAVKEKK